jgi:transcriptional regulator with XRE-family HTH domain
MTVFSEKLRARADAMGITQADLARRMDLDPRRVGHYMTGLREPDFQTLARLVRVLDTTSDALIGLSAAPEMSRSSLLQSQIAAICNALDAGTLEILLILASALKEHQHLPLRRGPSIPVARSPNLLIAPRQRRLPKPKPTK